MITDRKLKSMLDKVSDTGQVFNDGNGLFIRVSPKGLITFQIRYKFEGNNRKFKIGAFPDLSLAEARKQAAEIKILRDSGKDPAKNKKKVALSILDCLDKLAKDMYDNDPYKCKFISQIKRKLDDKSLHLKVDGISREQFYCIYSDLKGDTNNVARVLVSTLQRAFNFCYKLGLINNIEFKAFAAKDFLVPSVSLDHSLPLPRIREIFNKVVDSDLEMSRKSEIVILIITGCRVGELANSKIDLHVDLNNNLWTCTPDITKCKNQIIRPIIPPLKPYFEFLATCETVPFGGEPEYLAKTKSKAYRDRARHISMRVKKNIRKLTPDYNSRTHDFRHTLASRLADHGVNELLIERMLGHVVGGVRGVYNKAKVIEPMREAYQTYYDLLTSNS